ncbi:hypothetical protein PMIN02_008233 [Paraphaeosphaeria minitans]
MSGSRTNDATADRTLAKKEAIGLESAPQDSPTAIYSAFTNLQKRCIVASVAIGAIFSPLAVQIYLPALQVIAKDFRVSVPKANLTVTIYLVFQGLAPVFVAGFSDYLGRRPAYLLCFLVFIAGNIGLALSKNYATLLSLRMIQAGGIAAVQTLCQAVVADVITSAERGTYIGYITIPAVVGPTVGPMIGGALAEYLGWRSVFWFLTICATIYLVFYIVVVPETCREIVGDGSVIPPLEYRTLYQLCADARHQEDLTTENPVSDFQHPSRPSYFRMLRLSMVLILHPEFALLLFYGAVHFASLYAIGTTLATQFFEIFGFGSFKVGLMFLPMVGGTLVAVVLVGKAMNWNFIRNSRRLGLSSDKTEQHDLTNFPIERARLEIVLPLSMATAAVLIAWGWALQARTSIAVFCALGIILGISYTGVINAFNALVTDYYRTKAAGAVAIHWFCGCSVAAMMSAIIQPMIDGVGAGWAYTILGALHLACPSSSSHPHMERNVLAAGSKDLVT